MADAAPVAPVAPAPAAPAPEGSPTPETSEAADPKPKAPPKPKAEEELYELKVNGKTERLTRDQLLLRAQKAEAADRRFQEAARKAKEAEDLIAAFEADPEAVLAKMGKDPAALIEAHLAKKAKDATLTPEQRELEQVRRERDELKAKHEEVQKEKRTAAEQAADQRTAQRLEETLLAAAESYNIDRSPKTLEELVELSIELLDMGITPTADQVCQELIHRQKEHLTARDAKILANIPDDKLADYLGEVVMDRLRKQSLKSMPGPGKAKAPKEPREKAPAKGYMTEAEFERSLGLRK